MLKNLALIALILGLPQTSFGGDSPTRSVQGGDLIFTATSTGSTEEEALFKAEAQAVRMITIECSVPHRDTKIFDQTVDDFHGRFHAHVAVGLSIVACEEAKNASPETKKLLTSDVLSESQKAYETLLYGASIRKPATAALRPVEIPKLFDQPFYAKYQRYLSSQTECREEARALIRSGNTEKADELTEKCRN